MTRLGMDVRRSGESEAARSSEEPGIPACASAASLRVVSIDEGIMQATPVAQWNTWESRKIEYGEGDPYQIKPGDTICQVNGARDSEEMLGALAEAACFVRPKPLALTLQRPTSAVLGPASRELRRPATEPSPAASPLPQPRGSPAEASECSRRPPSSQATVASSRPPRIPSPWLPKVAPKQGRAASREDEASTRSPSNSGSVASLHSSRSSSVCWGEWDEQRQGASRSASPHLSHTGRAALALRGRPPLQQQQHHHHRRSALVAAR